MVKRPNHPLIHQLDQLSTDRWARRGVRALLRGLWISVCIWCVGLGGTLLWNWPLRLDLLGVAALATVGVTLALLLRPRLPATEVARRLDRRFGLNEQLSTAIEVAAEPPQPGSIASHLLSRSTRTVYTLHGRIVRSQRQPWNELITLMALSLVTLGLFVLTSINQVAPQARPQPLPPLVGIEDPLDQFPEQAPPDQNGAPGENGPPGSQPGPGMPGATGGAGEQSVSGVPDLETIAALAGALRDQGATRSAAEALDRGDLAGAAQDLRSLADQASQLSQEARDNLARALREAARSIAPRNPDLASRLRQNARDLENGGQSAAQALDDLASAIDELQNNPAASAGQPDQANPGQSNQNGQPGQGDQAGTPGSGTGAGNTPAGEQRTPSQSERLGVDGQPVELDAQGDDQNVPPTGQPPSASVSGSGSTSGGNGNSGGPPVGPDPLRVPLGERDVVQGYFSAP